MAAGYNGLKSNRSSTAHSLRIRLTIAADCMSRIPGG
jgi:hypothetical protein